MEPVNDAPRLVQSNGGPKLGPGKLANYRLLDWLWAPALLSPSSEIILFSLFPSFIGGSRPSQNSTIMDAIHDVHATISFGLFDRYTPLLFSFPFSLFSRMYPSPRVLVL